MDAKEVFVVGTTGVDKMLCSIADVEGTVTDTIDVEERLIKGSKRVDEYPVSIMVVGGFVTDTANFDEELSTIVDDIVLVGIATTKGNDSSLVAVLPQNPCCRHCCPLAQHKGPSFSWFLPQAVSPNEASHAAPVGSEKGTETGKEAKFVEVIVSKVLLMHSKA